MPLINEAERRRAGFRGEAPVVLADGQKWFLPKPRVRFCPDDSERGYRLVTSLRGDDQFQSFLNALEEASGDDSPPGVSVIGCQLRAARHLLLLNYDLTPEEVAEVLQFSLNEEDDPEGYAVGEAVMAVVYGNAPKVVGGTAD